MEECCEKAKFIRYKNENYKKKYVITRENISRLEIETRVLLLPYFLLHIHVLLLGLPGRVAQSVGHLTRKSGVLGSIPGLATYFRFSFRFFKKGSCQLLAKVCARSTG